MNKIIKKLKKAISRGKVKEEYNHDFFSASPDIAYKMQKQYIKETSMQSEADDNTSPVEIISYELSTNSESKRLAAIYNLAKIIEADNSYSYQAKKTLKSYVKENTLNLEETRMLVEFFGPKFVK